jgi:hypothetical protein
VAQLTTPLEESLGSKKSIFPSSTFCQLIELLAGIGGTAGSGSLARAGAAKAVTNTSAFKRVLFIRASPIGFFVE